MTLTHEDVQAFNKMFPDSAHEELNGATYIREHAITDRLDSIDPNWTWERLDIIQRGSQITFTGRLTVKGVWRDGVGMATITTNNSGREVNEAEKSAATDALKRAARLFGIGRYLLDLGKGQKPQAQQPNNRQQYQQRNVDKTTGEIKADKPATAKGAPAAKLTREQWAHLQAEYGSDLVRAGLKVEKGSDWQGTYEQAVNAILAVNVPF